MQYFINKAGKISAETVIRNNEYQVAAVESLSGIQVIKSFLLEGVRSQEFRSKAGDVAEIEFQQNRNQARMIVLQEIVFFSLIGGIVYVGVSLLDISIAVIVALLFVLYRLMPRVLALNTFRQSVAESLVKVHAVSIAMEKPAVISVISGTTPFQGFHAGIELKDVSFSYNGGANVLEGVGFSINKGEMTAIVGASGAGKSTLIDLILRNFDPVNGAISVDGINLREFDLSTWRQAIGVVSQDVFLFNETVEYNIGLDRPDVTAEQIRTAAERAYADEFIREMPHGYETKIGDRGLNMSGGQRQRIALARAIVQTPEILILDEATSSLDSESERLIQNYMNEIRGTCTQVVVAHRTATIRDADKIVVLEDGKVVEEGDWDHLIHSAGVFAKNQTIQAGG
jgi:subfamily B ATP-binding cassette protein MsbA